MKNGISFSILNLFFQDNALNCLAGIRFHFNKVNSIYVI